MRRKVLIVSPHFPPTDAPDMHRVRMSLPHFQDFGWEARVLAVDPEHVEVQRDPLLMETVPNHIPVHHASAFKPSWTRRIGFSALGLRALPFLYRAGAKLISRNRPDLVYFSTTMFPVLVLGRFWKRRFGIPFIVDMQDPWSSDYYETRPGLPRPPKYQLARQMHRLLERVTMGAVDGIVAVSAAYHETLRSRYPWIRTEVCRTIPFAASRADLALSRKMEWVNRFFKADDGLVHGVYVGVLGRVMSETCRAVCAAFRRGLQAVPQLFSKVRLHFIGTDYAPSACAKPTIRPIAVREGLEQFIFEHTERVPYFGALRLLRDAQFLLIPGSDNPDYTASKLYPYILANRPLLAIFRRESSVLRVLENTRAGEVVSFGSSDRYSEIAHSLEPALARLLAALPFVPPTDWEAFKKYEAHEMARQQCELFDRVVERAVSPA